MSNERKTCRHCQKRKGVRAFHKDASRPDGYYPWCKPCRKKYMDKAEARAYTDDWSKICGWCEGPIGGTHPNRQYCGRSCKDKAKRARSYGLEPQEYKSLLDATDGKCPICQKNITRWNIDHNHETGETTGLVCVTCNNAVLAFTYHDLEVAQRLVQYLRHPPVRRMFGSRFVSDKHKNQKPQGVLPMFLR